MLFLDCGVKVSLLIICQVLLLPLASLFIFFCQISHVVNISTFAPDLLLLSKQISNIQLLIMTNSSIFHILLEYNRSPLKCILEVALLSNSLILICSSLYLRFSQSSFSCNVFDTYFACFTCIEPLLNRNLLFNCCLPSAISFNLAYILP